MTRNEKISAMLYIADRLDAYFTYEKAGNKEYKEQAFYQYMGASYLLCCIYSNAAKTINDMTKHIKYNGRMQEWQIEEYANRLEK